MATSTTIKRTTTGSQPKRDDPPLPPREEEDNYPPPAVQGDSRLPDVIQPESGYPPPEPVRTIADEQRERSAYIESIGVEAYKNENDNRTEEEKAGSLPVEGSQYPDESEQTPRSSLR